MVIQNMKWNLCLGIVEQELSLTVKVYSVGLKLETKSPCLSKVFAKVRGQKIIKLIR